MAGRHFPPGHGPLEHGPETGHPRRDELLAEHPPQLTVTGQGADHADRHLGAEPALRAGEGLRQDAQVASQRSSVRDVGDAFEAVQRIDDEFRLVPPPPVDRGLARGRGRPPRPWSAGHSPPRPAGRALRPAKPGHASCPGNGRHGGGPYPPRRLPGARSCCPPRLHRRAFRYGIVSLLYSTAMRNRGTTGPGGYSRPAAKPCLASAVSREPRRRAHGLPPSHAGHPRGSAKWGAGSRVRIDCAGRDASRI